MPRGPSWLQGLPELPYVRTTSYAGQDVLLNMTFVTSLGVAVQPTSISYRMDSLESAQSIIPPTALAPTGASQVLQIPGAKMQLTRQWYGRENMQVTISAVVPDSNASSGSIAVQQVVIIELVQIAIPP